MGQVTVGVNGRNYTVGCDSGQEDHVAELAAYLDHHIGELKEAMGAVGDTRLMLLAGLMVADELSEAVSKLEAAQGELEALRGGHNAVADRTDSFEAETVAVIEGITARIENLTERLNA